MNTSSRRLVPLATFACMLAASLLGFSELSVARQNHFTLITVPGADVVRARGINNRGDIVGSYSIGQSPRHGFLLSEGVLTTIDVPGAINTAAFAINDAGKIVGAYVDTTGIEHGFLLTKGVFTTIDAPGATGGITVAAGINDRGDIVGIYCPGDSFHGFLLRKEVFSNVDPPGAQDTFLGGINQGGAIVGSWDTAFNNGFGQGFVLSDHQFVFFDVSHATGVTQPYGMNADEVIVGSYLDRAGTERGFRIEGEDFTTIDYPGATRSTATAINDSGVIVGYSTLGGTGIAWILEPEFRS